MRILALALLLAAAGSAVVSWSGRNSLSAEDIGWSQYDGAPMTGFADTVRVGQNLVDQTIVADGFDAFGAMRANDSRLWLGIAIAMGLAAVVLALVAFVGAARIAAVALLAAAAGTLGLALINRDHLRVRSYEWVPEEDLWHRFHEHVNAYSAMPWDDARLWLGLAVGFSVAAVGAGVVLRLQGES